MFKNITHYLICCPVLLIGLWTGAFSPQIVSNNCYARDLPKPALMLANVYHEGINLDEYWVSEKLDGVRAYWDGTKLISRGGNIYHAPQWFIADFPKHKMDGELWIARQTFEQLVSTVRDRQADDDAWREVKFMVFDMPDMNKPFDQRLAVLKTTIKKAGITWLKAVKQWRVSSHRQLMDQLKRYTDAGAEGLMLHRGSSLYAGKRSGDLLKVKAYQDAEAVVVKHLEGKGKYRNMLGALLLEMPDGTHFKIGTGFSDEQRHNPPPVGATITYQYRGMSRKGIPKFASFLRIRPLEK